MSLAASRYVRRWIELNPEMPPAVRFVLIELADAAGHRTGRAWLSSVTLARRTGYSRGTIIRALAVLKPYFGHADRAGRSTVWLIPTDLERLSTTARTDEQVARAPARTTARTSDQVRAHQRARTTPTTGVCEPRSEPEFAAPDEWHPLVARAMAAQLKVVDL